MVARSQMGLSSQEHPSRQSHHPLRRRQLPRPNPRHRLHVDRSRIPDKLWPLPRQRRSDLPCQAKGGRGVEGDPVQRRRGGGEGVRGAWQGDRRVLGGADPGGGWVSSNPSLLSSSSGRSCSLGGMCEREMLTSLACSVDLLIGSSSRTMAISPRSPLSARSTTSF
jgi:hypothetical protein